MQHIKKLQLKTRQLLTKAFDIEINKNGFILPPINIRLMVQKSAKESTFVLFATGFIHAFGGKPDFFEHLKNSEIGQI